MTSSSHKTLSHIVNHLSDSIVHSSRTCLIINGQCYNISCKEEQCNNTISLVGSGGWASHFQPVCTRTRLKTGNLPPPPTIIYSTFYPGGGVVMLPALLWELIFCLIRCAQPAENTCLYLPSVLASLSTCLCLEPLSAISITTITTNSLCINH